MTAQSQGSSGGLAVAPMIDRLRGLQTRFLAIWVALALLCLLSAIVAPDSLQETSLRAVLPFFAFLAIASMGQALVVMTGGIDLSIPAVITLVGVVLLNVTDGSNGNLAQAILICLALSTAIGLANGLLISRLRLNPLVVTLAMAALVGGATLWYRGSLQNESRVPPALSEFGAESFLGINVAVFVALGLMLLLSIGLRYAIVGRRFVAVGANPRSARVAGLRVEEYQTAAYAVAGLLYGITGILLSAFIRTPGLQLGDPYLLNTVVVVVLGGASLAGGVGSMTATVAGALFITQLEQMLKVMGASSAWQYVIEGVAIATGMALSGFHLAGVSWRSLPQATAARFSNRFGYSR